MNCRSEYCLNDISSNGKSPYCGKCRSRIFRSKHRVKSLYAINKHNAKRRGLTWEFTLDEWIIFCAETNYHKLVGLGPEDMTLDRIDNSLGYTYENTRMVTRSENGRKGRYEKRDKVKKWPVTLKGDPNIPF